MSIDERELRSRLAESAALAGPPRFITEDLAARVRRIRRRRRSRAGIIAAVAVVAVASAVAIPLALGGTSQPVIGEPGPPPPGLSYTMTVNGQTRAVPATGPPQLFAVTTGEKLSMTVEVTVPGPRAMTALWLGITNGVLSGHANMQPVLAASTRVPLRPGAHLFALHWIVPGWLRPGTSRQLSVEWSWRGPVPGNAERVVADFAVSRSGAAAPAAVMRQLRGKALHAVRNCDGAKLAWIRAVRTTFSKAMTATRGGNDLAAQATDPVYLVLMKGHFTFRDSGPEPRSCAHAGPTGRYFTAVFDAATFETLEAGLGNRPPHVPLQTLGPVLNLSQTS
jgi:hypothetical protein